MARTKRNSRRRGSVLQVSTTASSSPIGLPAGAFFLFGGLCLLMAGWGIWLVVGWMHSVLFTQNDRFELERIEARTDGVLTEELLQEWIGVEPGTNLYELDLSALRKRMESHAIVRKALVRRSLPDGLEIAVNERVPIARMGQVEGRLNWLLDKDGVLIQKSFQSKHLPFLVGVRQDVTLGESVADSPAVHALACIEDLRVLPSKMRDLLRVHVISVGHPDYLDVRTRDGFQILLPRVEDYEELLSRASRAVFDITQRNDPSRLINLTPDGRNVIVGPK
jgi:cell division protein FtsQ